MAKAEIGDLNSAFDDINYVIKIVPEFGLTFFYRGLIKYKYSKDFYGAISDFMRAIEYDKDDGEIIYYLGLTKYQIGDKNGACNDWRKAVKLGYTEASKSLARNCN